MCVCEFGGIFFFSFFPSFFLCGVCMRFSGRFLRPVVKVPGGQSKTARWVVGHFVEHEVFCEPFGGGLSVLLNKPRCGVEFVGDLDWELINLYLVLQDEVLFGRFCDVVGGVVYEEGVFDLVCGLCGLFGGGVVGVPDVGRAVLFYCRRRMSRNGEGRAFSWTRSGRLRGGRHGDVNAWETMKLLLPVLGERLGGVRLFCGGALELMGSVSRQFGGGVYYVDPPFPHDSRVSKDLYGEFEMSLGDHVVLLDFLLGLRAGGIYVSTAPNELYSRVLGGAGWDCDRRVVVNNMATGHGKGRKVVELWWRC